MQKPGGISHRVFGIECVSLTPAGGPGRGNALPALRFALLAPPELARLLVALLQLQALEQAVILNLLLQNADGLFDVIVDDSDFDFLQRYPPLVPLKTTIRRLPADSMVKMVNDPFIIDYFAFDKKNLAGVVAAKADI